MVGADASCVCDRRFAVSTLPGKSNAHPGRDPSTQYDSGDPEINGTADSRTADHAGPTGSRGLVAGRISYTVLSRHPDGSPGRLMAEAGAAGHRSARDPARRLKSQWSGPQSR